MIETRKALARGLAIFIGMAIVLAGYFWTHRPFGIEPGSIPPAAVRIGGVLLDALTVGALFVIAGAIGAWLLDQLDRAAPLKRDRLSRLEAVALETGIGLGAMALFGAVIGLIGLYRVELLWGAVALVAVLLRIRVGATLTRWTAIAASIRVGSGWEAFALASIALLLLLALTVAFAPPTHWDSLTYHLIAPTRHLRDGAILAYPDNFYLGFSQNVEILYGYAIGLFGRDTAAAPLHFGIGLVALLGVSGLVRRHAGRWAGWTAALLLMSAYSLWALFGWAYIDLGTLLYGALALIALSAWDEGRGAGWIVVMGAVAGLAAGVKYNAGALALVMGAVVLATEPRRAIRHGLIMAIAALIAFAPWAIKGIFLYGNPIYPLLFGGLEWDAGRNYAFTFPFNNFIARGWAWQLPILPFAATVFGQDRVDSYGFTAGGWLLTSFAALPLVWRGLHPPERRLGRIALIAVGVLWGVWALVGSVSGIGVQTRLMIMALPAFAAAGALAFVGVWRLPDKPIMIAFIVRILFMITMALTIIDAMTTVVRERTAAYLLGQVSLDEYLYANTGAYANAMKNLPAGSRVRLMWEPRGYLCPATVTCRADMVFDHWLRPLLEGSTADDVFASYRESGDDYLLFFDAGYRTYLEFSRDRALDESFVTAIESRMTPVWTDGVRYTLYGWND
ncbi:MAG: hypothetical protein SGJ24_20340 [Chloroflexota bacterium]|nr:hypothetical protein [Chloroflexota bacterium]